MRRLLSRSAGLAGFPIGARYFPALAEGGPRQLIENSELTVFEPHNRVRFVLFAVVSLYRALRGTYIL